MKNRNYGLFLGDKAFYPIGNGAAKVTVVGFAYGDNNGCYVTDEENQQIRAICEWCKRIPPDGFLDFYPIDGKDYTVVIEMDGQYPSLMNIKGEKIYSDVARIIYNYKKFFEDDVFKRMLIYTQEGEFKDNMVLYQAIDSEESFEKAIAAFENASSENQ